METTLVCIKGGNMAEENRETVVVNDRSSNPLGWIIGVIVIILLILFFTNGGFGLFGGNGTQGGSGTTIETPGSSNTQPTTGQ